MASPATDERAIVLNPGRLDAALRQLSMQKSIGILFAPDVIGDWQTPGLAGRMSVFAALDRLLSGSGLAFRETPAGTIIVFAAVREAPPPAIPEILVVARHTQNQDIRRTENDIQAYHVFAGPDIRSSQSDNLGQFLRNRLTSNAEALSPSQDPFGNSGSNRSEVNLRGLGASQTLILVDGSRMPSVPSQYLDLSVGQPDINGIPLFAIERIETITATAGGIYGPGATGGVVNVVMKRDYDGVDVGLTSGLSDRGDAAYRRFDARAGFTPDGGRTGIMFAVSRSVSTPLEAGDRNFARQSRALNIASNPDFVRDYFPYVDGILIRAGYPVLKPEFGSQSVDGAFTYLPAGYAGVASDGGATLVRNAGLIPLGLSPDGNGLTRSLTNGARTTSALLNIRHSFGDSIEAFVDFVGYRNVGQSIAGNDGLVHISQSAPTNPFDGDLYLQLALPGFDRTIRDRLMTWRLSNGLVINLPSAWKAELTFNLGGIRERTSTRGLVLGNGFYLAVESGLPGYPGAPVPDPFGPWDAFLSALRAYGVPSTAELERRSHFHDASLRLAGPLLRTQAGTYSLSLLAERRREVIPMTVDMVNGEAGVTYPRYSQTVSSIYGELRGQLVSRSAGPVPLRGLELQLALRYDDTRSVIPATGIYGFREVQYKPRQDAIALTAGFRMFPQEHLMVRASVATGVLPPTPQQMLQYGNYASTGLYDPRRGGELEYVGFRSFIAGTNKLRPERARTIGVGFVLNPEDPRRVRVALDYMRIEKRDEINTYHQYDYQYFLDNEATYPDRIGRDPLTAEDIANGYTGGRITLIDTSALNIGRTSIDTVDLSLAYDVSAGSDDSFHFRGSATWQPRFSRRYTGEIAATNYAGYADGALKWSAAAAIAWQHHAIGASLQGRFYGPYHAVDGFNTYGRIDLPVPSQFYLDAQASWRFRRAGGGEKGLELRVGIANLLGHAPPVVVNNSLGYSPYGDPRGRRFELSMATHF